MSSAKQKQSASFERDEHLEAMLQEQRETPKRYEWQHSLAEKKQAEAYAEAKGRHERRVCF